MAWLSAAALACTLSATSAHAAIGAEEFLASPAALAYKQGEYERALTELALLLQQHPDDVVFLRYLGMASHKLGRFAEAEDYFAQALAQQPDNAAVHYWLGATRYELGRTAEAEDDFRRVLALDPDSTYAANAREWLAVLAQGAAPASAQPWTLGLQAGLQYDDNVALAPDGGSGGLRFIEQLSGSYRLFEAAGWTLTLGPAPTTASTSTATPTTSTSTAWAARSSCATPPSCSKPRCFRACATSTTSTMSAASGSARPTRSARSSRQT